MKRIVILLLAVVCICIFCLTACKSTANVNSNGDDSTEGGNTDDDEGDDDNNGDDNNEHIHEWSLEFTADGGRHYQTCSGCNEKKYGPHNYTNLVCDECENELTATVGTEGLLYELNEDGKSYSAAGKGTATESEIVISSVYEGLPVTAIKDGAFRNASFTGVTVPNSVNYIGDNAFRYCTKLASITLPDSVISIGATVFYNCALTEVTIPRSVISIGDEAFKECKKLTGLTIENGVTSIGVAAFQACSALEGISIPNSVTSIGEKAFMSCTAAKTLTIGNGLTAISNNAFYGCSAVTEISVPDGVTSIGEHAFDSCRAAKSITIPNGVTALADYTFYYCEGLKSFTIPASVTSIGKFTFSTCTSLTSITIPASVTSIAERAFISCTSLKEITVDDDNQNFKGIGGHLYSKDGKTLIQYAIGDTAKGFIVPSGVTEIAGYAFFKSTLTSITIPDSVITVGERAFMSCDSLTVRCRAKEQPEGWATNWNSSNRPVIWGY